MMYIDGITTRRSSGQRGNLSFLLNNIVSCYFERNVLKREILCFAMTLAKADNLRLLSSAQIVASLAMTSKTFFMSSRGINEANDSAIPLPYVKPITPIYLKPYKK